MSFQAYLDNIEAKTARPTAVEQLTDELFDGAHGDSMAEEVAAWLARSRRFRAFAEANREKIRKKLRGATDADARRDVRAELHAAHLMLADRRIELTFEAYGSGKPGPDFTVAYRGARSFNLEVTRVRRTPDAASHGGPLLAKLRQLPPSTPNALVVAIEGETAGAFRRRRGDSRTAHPSHHQGRGLLHPAWIRGYAGVLRAVPAAGSGLGMVRRRRWRCARDPMEQRIRAHRGAGQGRAGVSRQPPSGLAPTERHKDLSR